MRTSGRSGDGTPRLNAINEEDEERLEWRRVSRRTQTGCRCSADAPLSPDWCRLARGGGSPPPRRTGADTLVVASPPIEGRTIYSEELPPSRRKGGSGSDARRGANDGPPECNTIKNNEEERRIWEGEGGHRMVTRSLSKRENNANRKGTQTQLNSLQEEWEEFNLNTKQQKGPDIGNIVVGDGGMNANTCNIRIETTLRIKEEGNTQLSKNIRLQSGRGVEHTKTFNQTRRSNRMQRNDGRELNIKDTFETPAVRSGPVTRSRSRVQTSTKPI